MTGVLEKIKESARKAPFGKLKKFSWHIFYAVAAFFMGSISLAGTIAPFAAAFTAAATPEFLLPVALGAAGGYLVFCTELTALQYVGAVTVICFVKYFTQRLIKPFFRMYIYTLTGFLALLFSSILTNLAQAAEISQLLVCFAQSMICAAVTCFFIRFLLCFRADLKKYISHPLKQPHFCFLRECFCLFLMAFPFSGCRRRILRQALLFCFFLIAAKKPRGVFREFAVR